MKIFIADLKTVLSGAEAYYTVTIPGEEHFHGRRRDTYRAGRILLFSALNAFYGSYEALPHIRLGEHGKPFFDDSPNFFNLSHSGDFLALAVADVNQGLDLEVASPRKRLDDLIKRYLSCGERDYLEAMSLQERHLNFGFCWTLREALIKESGLGIAGLSKVKVDFKDRAVTCQDNGRGRVYSYYLPSLTDNIAGMKVPPAWLAFFVNQDLMKNLSCKVLPFEIYLVTRKEDPAGGFLFTTLNKQSFFDSFDVN